MANPWQFFSAEQIAVAAECPVEAVRENWPRLVEQLDLCGINHRLVQIGMIGTVAKESASSFRPVREAFFLGEPAAENHRKTLAYYPFYGRGYIQVTHRGNYERYGRKVAELWRADPSHPDFDLVGNPDRALDPTVSAAVSALFFRDTKTLQGYGLVDACLASDWDWVRRLVLGGADPDGTARLTRIAAALGGAPVTVTYNANEPAHPQDKSFDCSQESLEWALWALGRKPADNWMEPTMIAEGVMSVANGLEDASGAGLAAFVGRHWGEFGFYANNEPAVTFDDVAAEGTGPGVNGKAYPLLIGGRRFGPGGHWVGVRGYDPSRDVILLANPAPGFTGIQQELTRQQWDERGPWSMVRVLHNDLLSVFNTPTPEPTPEPTPQPQPEPPSAQALIAEIRARLDELERLVA